AEDGIRDDLVTGVQTCALPIFRQSLRQCILDESCHPSSKGDTVHTMEHITAPRASLALRTISDRILPTVGYRPNFGTVDIDGARSEERRVGKERSIRRWRCRGE